MPLQYERQPLPVPINERTVVQLPPRVFRVRLTGLLFETNKTFLLPGAMDGIRGLVDFYGTHPDMALVITGHADRVGSASANLALSDERAQSMASFLKDDVEGWLAWYSGKPASSPWGTREDQHMLSAVRDDAGEPFYAGPVHGTLDASTRDAARRFQSSRDLEPDGVPGPITRRALIEAYMGLDATTLPEAAVVERLGCGENHNAVETADEVDEQENRRVEIFLFDGGTVEPPVPGKCPGPGCAYESWLAATIETIDFGAGLTTLLVHVTADLHDGTRVVMGDADVQLVRGGFPTRGAKTNADGLVEFADVTSGTWSIHASKEDFDTDTKEVEVHPGGFVVLGADEAAADAKPENRSNLVGAGGTAAAIPTGAVPMSLKDDRFLVRWVDQPSINPDAQEKQHEWKDDRVVFHPNAAPATSSTAHDDQGVFALARGKSTATRVEEAVKTGPHEVAVQWRIEVIESLPPGKLVDLDVSTRLRMSVWVFHSPFIKSISGKDDVVLDDLSIDAMSKSHLDDLSIVSTIGWVKGSNPPRVDWRDHAPAGSVGRSAKYLKKLVDALHAHGIQVQMGWSSVDVKKGSSDYNVAWSAFLANASTSEIDTLAANAVQFFTSQGIDLDGIGFDFEINSLGAAQAANLAHLYRKTAEIMRGVKRDGLVTYANAPFEHDGEGQLGFMNIQPFGLCRDTPNLFARPMCFDEHTVPAGVIRKAAACAVRKESDDKGAGIHPAHAQFGLFARELEQKGEFDALITDTLRPNRLGLMLYQLPKYKVLNQVTGSFDRTALLNFLADCVKWNELLNPNEALPRTPGQPLQVPRTPDFGI